MLTESVSLSDLPRLPRDEEGPVFAEPWQAQAFALAVTLSQQGHYTWKEWAAALAEELQAAARRGEPDDGSRYYEHWLAALETLVAKKGLADPAALLTRKHAWAAAYRKTPHGRPVELRHSPGVSDAGWLLLGLAWAFAAYWLLPHAPNATPGLGLAASAGLGILLGMRHAFEPDHLAAVTTLMTGERSSAKAAWLGAWWGLGHTLTLVLAGALLVVLKVEMPAMAERVFEFGVVVLLTGFGVRAMYQGVSQVSAGPTHTHGKPKAASSWFADRWTIARPLLVGAVHGLAGSGALIALLVPSLSSTAARLAYLVLFGVGSTLAMAALSGLLGWQIARMGAHRSFVRNMSLAVGGVSTALGVYIGYPLIAGLL